MSQLCGLYINTSFIYSFPPTASRSKTEFIYQDLLKIDTIHTNVEQRTGVCNWITAGVKHPFPGRNSIKKITFFLRWGENMKSGAMWWWVSPLLGRGEMYSTAVPGAGALIFHPRIVVEEGNLCFHSWFEAGQLVRCALCYHVQLHCTASVKLRDFFLVVEENAQRGTE